MRLAAETRYGGRSEMKIRYLLHIVLSKIHEYVAVTTPVWPYSSLLPPTIKVVFPVWRHASRDAQHLAVNLVAKDGDGYFEDDG